MDEFVLRSARFIAAETAKRVLHEGDRAVDATMGNGHDTLMLCNLVGDTGRVYAFDVQQQAVENTRQRLIASGVLKRAELFITGHEHMAALVPEGVRLVMFNLGWLPGSDKTVRTQWATTEKAVEAALELLAPLGVCIIAIYPGHEEGEEERRQLMAFLSALKPQRFNVLHHRFLNAGEGAPECAVIQKQA